VRSKILYVSHSGVIAGAEVCLLTLLGRLDRQRFEPVVIVPWSGPLRAEIEKLGVTTHVVGVEWWIRGQADGGSFPMKIFDAVEAIGKVLEREQPQIVHTNSSVVMAGALAASVAGIPHVWHVHEILSEHPRLSSIFPLPLIYAMMSTLSDRIIAVSEAVKRPLTTVIDPSRIATIHNGVDATRLAVGESGSLRGELSLPDDAIVAATIGWLVAEKGHDNLLRAAAFARERGARIHYLIVGDGTLEAEAELRRAIVRLGLEDAIHFLGPRNDIGRILQGIDFLIVPSRAESFSLVAVEAMAVGRPVITTDCGGPSEIVVDGETGFIVPVDDSERLGGRILDLSSDVSLRAEMGTNGFARFAERFRAEVFTSRIEALYEDTLQRSTVSSRPAADREITLSLAAVYQDLFDAIDAQRELEARLARTHEQVGQRNEQLTQTSRQLAETSEQLAHTREELTQRSEQLAHTREELTQRSEQLVHTREQLTQTSEQLAHTREELTQRSEQLAHTREQLTQTDEQLTQTNERLALTSEQLTRSSEQRAEANERLRAALAQIDSVSATLSRANRELEAIKGSRGWRLMAPYRAVGRVVRAVLGPERFRS
jgi:glycosyltransferase involved in cell wall biosynthesis